MTGAKHPFKAHEVPESQRMRSVELYTDAAKATGYRVDDVRQVVMAYHQAICDSIAQGKIYYMNQPYFCIEVKKVCLPMMPAGMLHTLKADYPERTMMRVKMKPGMAYKVAAGYENQKVRNAVAQREKRAALKAKKLADAAIKKGQK